MILDSELQLSDRQAVTFTANSQDSVDSLALVQSGELCLVVQVNATAAADGDASVTFQLICSAESDLSHPVAVSGTVPVPINALTAGRKPIYIAVAPKTFKKLSPKLHYLGLRYMVANGPLTAGAFSAWLLNSSKVPNNYELSYTI